MSVSEKNVLHVCLAGITIGITSFSREIQNEFCDYLCKTDKKPVFIAPYLSERGCSYESPSDRRLFERRLFGELLKRQTVLVHASTFSYREKAAVLLADSGGGKSTLSRLFMQFFPKNTVMINDDLPLCRFYPDEIRVYGSPWRGKHKIGGNLDAPLHSIYILEKGSENLIRKAKRSEVYSAWFKAMRYDLSDPEETKIICLMLEHLVREIPIYHFTFTKTPEAAELLRETIGITGC